MSVYYVWDHSRRAFFREGPTPHWTTEPCHATAFAFMTTATLTAYGLGLDNFDVVTGPVCA